jgi:hypothetical protein
MSGKEISIKQAPTRWGKVSFRLHARLSSHTALGKVDFDGARVPGEVHFRFPLPKTARIDGATVNARPVTVGGGRMDTIIFGTQGASKFEIVVHLG